MSKEVETKKQSNNVKESSYIRVPKEIKEVIEFLMKFEKLYIELIPKLKNEIHIFLQKFKEDFEDNYQRKCEIIHINKKIKIDIEEMLDLSQKINSIYTNKLKNIETKEIKYLSKEEELAILDIYDLLYELYEHEKNVARIFKELVIKYDLFDDKHNSYSDDYMSIKEIVITLNEISTFIADTIVPIAITFPQIDNNEVNEHFSYIVFNMYEE